MTDNSNASTATSILRVAHSRPGIRLPVGACDCHVHVFGPTDRFPYSPMRPYTPAPAVVEDLAHHQDVLGLERVIIVQPSVYGSDNRCTLDAIARFGANARGVAVIDEATSRDQLEGLKKGGISGIRLNLAAAGNDASAAISALRHANRVAEEFGWHIQIFATTEVIQALRSELKQLSVPLVLDHFGGVHASAGVKHEGFKTVVGLLSGGNCYVKISAPYLVSEQPIQDDVIPLVKGLAAVNSERLLWGSNWPHPLGGLGDVTRGPVSLFREVDDGVGVTRLANWISDESLLAAVMVDNPAKLYGFVTRL